MNNFSRTEENSLKVVKDWISEFIIGHEICPFASYSIEREQLQYFISKSYTTRKRIKLDVV